MNREPRSRKAGTVGWRSLNASSHGDDSEERKTDKDTDKGASVKVLVKSGRNRKKGNVL